MPKVPSLDDTVIARKGHAEAVLTTLEPSKDGDKEPSNQGNKEERRRAWNQPGQETWKKTNYEMPLRVQTKLKEMKNWGYIPNVYKFVAEAVEKEIDRVIAKAEQEGF
jgi:hypothetical protein